MIRSDRQSARRTRDRSSCHCIEGSDQKHPQGKKKGMQKGKMVVEEALQIAEKEEKQKAKEKRKDIPI